jgi:histidine triad (HIT) family protein
MFSHAPDNYHCWFCDIVQGSRKPSTQPEDVIWRTDAITAFIGSHWWPNNPGHVIIIPNTHYEALYDIPPETGATIFEASRQVAIAFKRVYQCDGTSTRQHNEPAGYQEIFHYHLHVFPRYENDYLYDLTHQRRESAPEDRLPYARKLRAYFDALQQNTDDDSGS